jgi:hypothetical protein
VRLFATLKGFHQLRCFLAIIFSILHIASSGTIIAAEARGPSLSQESTQKSALKDRDGKSLNLTQAKKMTELKLYVPLPTPSSIGSLLVRYDLVKSDYSYRDETKYEADLYSTKRSVSALGLVYQTPIENGRPSYLVLASRYGAGPDLSASQPMGEYIAAVRWDHSAIPWFSLPSDAVERRLTLLVRYRNFPNRQSWLGLVGLNFESLDGLRLEAHIPSHIQFGIKTMAKTWYLYSEARFRPS